MTSVMRIAHLTGTSSHRGTVMTASTDVAVTPAATTEQTEPVSRPAPIPEYEPGLRSNYQRVAVAIFTGVPMAALLTAIPVAWVWGLLNWQTVVIGIAFYLFTGLGIAMGFHRFFTHKSFKSNRAFKIALGVAGTMAVEGPLINWVSDHRKHHKYSDREGDPHSPWRFGDDLKALTKGMVWAHMGWLLDRKITSHKKYSPDWLADRDIVIVHKLFPPLVALTLVLPAVIGGLATMSIQGALIAFFWASLVRVSFLHHVTWSINSICHTLAGASSRPGISPRTWHGLPSCRSASPGTTCTTRTRPAPGTACSRARSTSRPAASGWSRNSAGSTTSGGRTRCD